MNPLLLSLLSVVAGNDESRGDRRPNAGARKEGEKSDNGPATAPVPGSRSTATKVHNKPTEMQLLLVLVFHQRSGRGSGEISKM